jgi:hypothetical protein
MFGRERFHLSSGGIVFRKDMTSEMMPMMDGISCLVPLTARTLAVLAT